MNGARRNTITAKSFKVTLNNVKNVSVPNIPGIEVVTKRIRVCLFDPTSTKQYISNVFTMNAVANTNNNTKDNVWTFPSEVTKPLINDDLNNMNGREVCS
jgi:hypothetical protein